MLFSSSRIPRSAWSIAATVALEICKMSALDYIRNSGTRVSCDTMSVAGAEAWYGKKYINCTSNQAIAYNELVVETGKDVMAEAAQKVKAKSSGSDKLVYHTVNLAIAILGKRMLEQIDGSVLSQTNPSLAYDIQGTVQHARDLIAAYKELGIGKERVIIKIPSTWEGLQACKQLREEDGINTLGTMIFSFAQAVQAAAVGCIAISPYVNSLETNFNASQYKRPDDIRQHRGVMLSKQIHEYYRTHKVATKLVPAGMLDPAEPIALAGVDEITAQPALLQELSNLQVSEGSVLDQVSGSDAPVSFTEEEFRVAMQESQVAYDMNFAINGFMGFEQKLSELAQKALK